MARGMIAEFLVKVGSVGLGKTKKDVDALAQSTENVGRAHTRTAMAAHAYYDTQAKGVIGTANGTKSFSKMAQTMNSGGGVVGAYATLAANIFAVTAAFNALRNAAQMEQVEKGLEALGNRTGQTLTVAAKGLKEISGNTLTMEQSMRSAAQVFSAGFGTKDLERIGKVANDVSVALGRNMTDSMDRLTRGVIKLEPELLDELGLMTKIGDATKKYALETGKAEGALNTVERRQAFLNAVLEEGEAKFGGLANAAGNTRGYDSMSAALADLTKVTLTAVNTVFLPLSSFLGANPAVMAGGVLLFAATLKDQILPGMSQMAEKSKTVAENFKEAQTKEINDIIEGNKNDQSVPMDRLADKIKANTAGLRDYKQAQVEITEEYRKTEAQVLKYNRAAAETITPARTANYNANLAILKSLKEEYNEVTEAITIQTRTGAEVRKSEALQAAAVGNTAGALRLARQAGREYYDALEVASGSQGGFTRAMNISRAAAFSFGTSMKIVGAGILSALPYLGLAIAAFGLIKGAIESLKSAEDKLIAKKAKEFSEVYVTLGDKLRELQNINESSLMASQRTNQALLAETNAIIELADRYKALREAKLDADGALRDGQDIARWWETYTVRNRDSNAMQIDRRSEVLGDIGKGMNKEQAQALEALRLTAPKAYDAMKELNGGMAGFAALPVAERARLTAEALEAVAVKARLANSAINSFNAANKEAGDALTTFIRSATPTTNFDATVRGLNNITASIVELQNASFISGEQFSDLIMGLSDGIVANLSLDSARFINDTKTIQILENELETEGELTVQQQRQLEIARERLSTSQVTTQVLVSELNTIRQTFIAAQEIEISLKAQNALISANLKANQENYALTVEGLAAQIDAENAIINNQIAQLRNSRSLLENQIAQKNQSIEQLQLERQLLAVEYQREVASKRARLDELKHRSVIATITGNMLASAMAERAIAEQENAINEAAVDYLQQNAVLQQNIAARAEEVRVAALGVATINNEIAATSLGLVGTQERLARLTTFQLKQIQELEEKYDSILKTVSDAQEVEEKRLELMRVGRIGLEFELRAGRQRLALEKTSIENQRRRAIELNQVQRREAISRGTDAAAQAAAAARFDRELVFLDAQYSAQITLLEQQALMAEAEKVIFDVRSQGLEWQRDSLQLIERQVEAQNSLLQSNYDMTSAQERLNRTRQGFGEITPAGREAEQIRAATLAYNLAVQESGTKKALIELEFALLEAQQIQLQAELQVRRAWLAENNSNGQFNTAIAQIDRVTSTLRNVDYEGMARAASTVIDRGIETARINLEESMGRSAGIISSAAYDIVSRSRATQEAELALATAAAVEPAAAVIASSIVEPMTQAFGSIESSTDILVTSLDNLALEINQLRVNELTRNLETSNSAIETIAGTPQQMISAIGRLLQEDGLRVSEANGFGGVTPGVHRGRGHAEGRAIDVNIGRGNVEWNNAEQRERFNRLDSEITRIFGDAVRVLWGPAEGHRDHMHIEFLRTITAEQTQALQGLITANNDNVQQVEVVNTPDTVEDVVVTGRRREETFFPEPDSSNLRPATNLLLPPEPAIGSAVEAMIHFESLASQVTQHFADLGPAGEAVTAAVSGISLIGITLENALNSLKSDDSLETKFINMAAVASAAVSTIQSVLAASSRAKVEAIDKEIAAEQKRDGKSAESVAKIAALEKKKDAQAKKSFEVNKKLQMAQAVISTASAIAQTLAMGGFFAIPLAAMVGALGAAQLAIIAGTSYQSTSSTANAQVSTPSTLTIGKRGDSVDLARNNANAGGEIGYLRGARGQGNNASNYNVIGSAYGGALPRGYGKTAFAVGEHGPEIITPETPITVRPMSSNDNNGGTPQAVNFNITTLDASGVEDILRGQRGNIIGMLREAANASGQSFLEDVNVSVYTKPNVGKL